MTKWREMSIANKFRLTFSLITLLLVVVAVVGLVALQANPVAAIVLAIVVSAAIVLTGVLLFILNHSLTQNIFRLTQAAQALQQGNLQTRFDLDCDDELGDLAHTLNQITPQIYELVDNLEAQTSAVQNRLYEAIENISEGLALYDDQDRLMLFNSKYRDLFGPQAHLVNYGARFETITRLAAEQNHYLDAVGRADEWLAWRLQQHRQPDGVFEQPLADGRWIQVSEYKTKDGGTFSIHTDVTARKQVETALRRHNEYLEALHDTTIDLISRLHLNELLEDIISRAGELLETKHGYIYLVDPDASAIECKVGVGIYNQLVGHRLRPGDDVAGKIWQSGQALAVADYRRWPGRSAKAAYDRVQSLVGVPLKSGGQVAGVLGLAYDDEINRQFNAAEIDLLSRFAQLASLALTNAQLYETAQDEKQRSDKLLNVVIPIGVALSAEQNFDRLLEKILLEAKQFCNADAGTLYLRTEDNQLDFVIVRNQSLNLAMGGADGSPIDFPPIPLYQADGQPNYSNVAAYVALTGNAVNIADAYQAEGFNFSGTKRFDEQTGYRSTSFLTIPLKNAHNYVDGVLQLINALHPVTGNVIPFDKSLEQIAGSLSSLATVALEAYIREQNLRQQIQQLRIEIDEVKRQRQVNEIVETDFFQDLQNKARLFRRRSRANRTEK